MLHNLLLEYECTAEANPLIHQGTFCFMAEIQKSAMVRIITCTGSKSSSYIIFNIVYMDSVSFLSYYMWGIGV